MADEIPVWKALNMAMDTEMAADDSVFTLGEDVGLYGGSGRTLSLIGDYDNLPTPFGEEPTK